VFRRGRGGGIAAEGGVADEACGEAGVVVAVRVLSDEVDAEPGCGGDSLGDIAEAGVVTEREGYAIVLAEGFGESFCGIIGFVAKSGPRAVLGAEHPVAGLCLRQCGEVGCCLATEVFGDAGGFVDLRGERAGSEGAEHKQDRHPSDQRQAAPGQQAVCPRGTVPVERRTGLAILCRPD